MAASAEPLLRHLQRLLTPQDAASDTVLLERFAAQRDESAFAALLARHGPMVLGVSRRVLRDTHKAEDVFQAVFLVLARKAAILRRPQSLAAWLYGTARHLAMKARRGDARLRQREQDRLHTVPISTDPLDELAARELLLILDEEMEHLPEIYRLPLLLCGLEGRPLEEAARILGWTTGSVKGRLERGRKQLHARLTRRGLAFSGALLTLGVSQGGTASAAARLTAETLQAALAFTRGECGAISAEVVALAESGITSMTMAKAKIGLALLLVASLAAGTGALAYQVRTQGQTPSERAVEPKATASKATTEKQAAKDRYGDPLPPGALARLGTIRLCHGGNVTAVAFAPDGKSVVSGGDDGWAFQWDVATGKRLRAFFREGAIHSVAIDPEGKRLALADRGNSTVKLYELATGKELATCAGHRGGTRVVVFSPDGKRLASGGNDERIRVWDAATLREVRSWQVNGDIASRLRFTPDGKGLASSVDSESSKDVFRFWDVATGEERPRRKPLADLRVSSFCFSADGKTLLTGTRTAPGLLQLWDLATGKEIRTVARTKGAIRHVALTPDGKSAWTSTQRFDVRQWETDVRQWDLATGKELLHLPDPGGAIEGLAVSPDGKRLVTSVQFRHVVFLWDTTTGRKVPDFAGHRSLSDTAVFTSDGRHLWTGGHDDTIRFWSAASGEQLRLFSTEPTKSLITPLARESVCSLALPPDGKMLAAGVIRAPSDPTLEKCDVHLWDLTTGKEREPLRGHGGWVTAVAFSPDGRLLASRGKDQTIRLWDVATGKERSLLRCQETEADGIAFSPDGLQVIAGLDKETIGFWNVKTGQLTRQLSTGPSCAYYIPLLSRDGRLLITGGGDQPLRVWEVASGKERCRIERPNAKTYVVAALSPDCRILAWSDYDQPIKLWDLLADKQLGELGKKANMASVVSLAFSPDGQRLASTHSDGTTLIWDVAVVPAKRPTPAAKLSAKEIDAHWDALANEDATVAYRAIRALTASPQETTTFLHQHLRRVEPVEEKTVTKLILDLDSDDFATRDRAFKELSKLDRLAAPVLRKALTDKPSVEMRRRIQQLLEQLTPIPPSAQLRPLRAVWVLELLDTPDARRLLETLAQGAAEAHLTQDAKASLERLSRRSATRP